MRTDTFTPDQWSAPLRIAFRFVFLYFGLYVLITGMLGNMIAPLDDDFPDLSRLTPFRQPVEWTARHVFHITSPLIFPTGSGDTTFDWILALCMIVFVTVATIVWSLLDHRRPNYVSLHKWYHLSMRLALGTTMLGYGFDKLIPLQMPFPSLMRLVEPYGDFSPMGVLWYSIGTSQPYEIFAGSMEVLAGILVMIPRTAALGALVALVDCVEIFSLNMTYDVPVKLFSFHLLLLSLILLAPDFPRLMNFFLRDRAVGRSTQPSLFHSLRANRIALVTQIVFILYVTSANLWAARKSWYIYGGGAPKSVLYGIWEIDQLSIDGRPQSLLATDASLWHRVIFDSTKDSFAQRMDNSFDSFIAEIDATKQHLSLASSSDHKPRGEFTYQRPTFDRLLLDGSFDGKKMHLESHLLDRSKFLLISRGFHWIQDLGG